MIAGLLAALLLLAPDAEETSYEEIAALFAAEAPAPEPPAGLRAPPGSDRHERARRKYADALTEWKGKEAARRQRLLAACDRHLDAFPEGRRRNDVLYLRGATRFRDGDHAGARADLEAYLGGGAEGPAATAARAALVESCRALGDYSAALRHGGPQPDLLEEAGEIDRAIDAARRAGADERVGRWTLIGRPFPGDIAVPEGAAAVIVEAGRRLPPEAKTRLTEQFSAEKGKVVFLSAAGEYLPAVYLLDAQGVVRAADPRPDTLEHRVRRLLGRG